MNNLSKKNLLSMLCVFSFVAFCFAVSNTFGGTYAYTEVTSYQCPDGYYEDSNDACVRSAKKTTCPGNGVFDSGSELCGANADSNGECPEGYSRPGFYSGTGITYDCSASAIVSANCNENETVVNEIYCSIGSKSNFPVTKYQYNITLDANGGNLTSSSSTLTCTVDNVGDSCTKSLGSANLSGYDFVGWDTSSSCSSPVTGSVNVTDDATFYACYEKNETEPDPEPGVTSLNVIFDTNGGELISGNETASCELSGNDYCYITYQQLPTVLYDGYELRGWSASQKCTTTIYNGSIKATEDNQTFYACWREVSEDEGNEYKAYLNANEGWIDEENGYNEEEISCETSSSTETSCIVDEFTTPTRDGFTFKGYGETTSCTSGIYEFELSASNYKKTYYACWVEDNSSGSGGAETGYNVTFELDGGKLLVNGNISNDYEVRLSEIDSSDYIASKANHTFLGWSKSANSCTNPILNETIKFTEDTTLYACFKKITEDEVVNYKVVFNTNGGSLYVDGELENKKVFELDKIDYSDYEAVKDGFVFKGWRTNTGSCKDAKRVISESLSSDLNLVACYTEEEKEIDENPNTGSSLLYIAFLVGILALGYTGYYAYSYVRNKK